MSTATSPAAAGYEPESTGTPNFLVAAWRRWPWVLVGIFLGTTIGFLMLYLARPKVFQSSAQVLVVKKRSDVVSGPDSRMTYMEDYVATQVTLLRTEAIMKVAADKIAAENLEDPSLRAMASEPKGSRAGLMAYMQGNLAVSREKDVNSPTGGTNILNLAVKGSYPRDCKYLLETIIDTYSNELRTVYDSETEIQIKQYTQLNKQFQDEINQLESQKQEWVKQMAGITTEDLSVIRMRVSSELQNIRTLNTERSDVAGKLELIKDTGTDPRSRSMLLTIISDAGRGLAPSAKLDFDNPDSALKSLEYEKAELSRRYGKDHHFIQAIDAKMAFLRDLNRKSDPKDKSQPFDALALYSMMLQYRAKKIETELNDAKQQNKSDEGKVVTASVLLNNMDVNTRKITELSKKIDDNRALLAQKNVSKESGGFAATVVYKPGLSQDPIAPKLSQALLLGAAGGLLLGLGLAALAELADKSFRSPAEIRARLGIPVVGHIPPLRVSMASREESDVEPSVVCATRPKSVEAEAYRGVRTSLYFSLHGRGHQVIQVTSPNPGDGKSTLAANLAVSMAQSGKRVLLIDCDFRRPRQHKVFRLADPGPGFGAVIIGDSTLANAIRRTAVENLWVLSCGSRPANPAELLTSPAFAKVLEQAKSEYDFVILDTPPLLAVSDPSVVAPRADGVLMVLRMTNKARPQAERAREQLAQLGANVLGVVVNGAGRSSDGYGYGSGYHYEYEYADEYQDEVEEAPGRVVLPKKG